jgi:hypothetical protein
VYWGIVERDGLVACIAPGENSRNSAQILPWSDISKSTRPAEARQPRGLWRINGKISRTVETMVGRVGFEPTTNGLKVHCSTD